MNEWMYKLEDVERREATEKRANVVIYVHLVVICSYHFMLINHISIYNEYILNCGLLTKENRVIVKEQWFMWRKGVKKMTNSYLLLWVNTRHSHWTGDQTCCVLAWAQRGEMGRYVATAQGKCVVRRNHIFLFSSSVDYFYAHFSNL